VEREAISLARVRVRYGVRSNDPCLGLLVEVHCGSHATGSRTGSSLDTY